MNNDENMENSFIRKTTCRCGDYIFIIKFLKSGNGYEMYSVENPNSVILNTTILVEPRKGQRPSIRSKCIMMPESTKQYKVLSKNNNLGVVEAVPLEYPFIVNKRENAIFSRNYCNLFIGEYVISVGFEPFQNLPEYKLRLLLDETQSCEIEKVDFQVFLEFFKNLFTKVPEPTFRDVQFNRKLMSIYQRFSTERICSAWEQNIRQFYMSDFPSATNLFCVAGTPVSIPNDKRNQEVYKDVWRGSFSVKYGENDIEKLVKTFDIFHFHWRFYTYVEKINNVEYLGIGIIVNPCDMLLGYPYWRQPAEIDIIIKTDKSIPIRKFTLSREFNHYQSSAGCPVIARLDEISLNQGDNLIFDIQVKNQGRRVPEYAGEKNITLIIDNKKIITSKNLLIHHFKYFKTLSGSHFDDRNHNELVLPDVKYKDMQNVFDVIYNRSKYLTLKELEQMLILANRFSCPYIINYVDIAISDMPVGWRSRAEIPISFEEKKYFAEKYRQLVLVKECVERTINPCELNGPKDFETLV